MESGRSTAENIHVTDKDFPCSLTISTPFPTHRLASFALQALRVDPELSPLVRRSFSLASRTEASEDTAETIETQANSRQDPGSSNTIVGGSEKRSNGGDADEEKMVLRTLYEATTNRMLRVAVNGFMESLALVIDVMENLDVDVMGQGEDAYV